MADERYKALGAQGQTITKSPADDVIHSMIHEFNRKGKAAGAGFYDYPADAKKQLWSGLSHWKKDNDISEQEMIDRFLFVQALDTVACLEKVSWNLWSMPMWVPFLVLALPPGRAVQYNS